jgi:hypothetical protein
MHIFRETSRGGLPNPHLNVPVHGKLKDAHIFTDPVMVLSQIDALLETSEKVGQKVHPFYKVQQKKGVCDVKCLRTTRSTV